MEEMEEIPRVIADGDESDEMDTIFTLIQNIEIKDLWINSVINMIADLKATHEAPGKTQ